MATTSLAVKYRPQTWDDVSEQDTIKAILQQQLDTNTIKNAYLFCGSAGTGKAQPLYSKVLTPNGYITMGDVAVGQVVYTRKGEHAKVTAVYPQGKRPIYEITLQDRTKIRVADNHLNSVYVYNQYKKCREDYVLTTLDLIEFIKTSKYKVRIDAPSVDFDKQNVLIDPYLLGALIGDGSLHGNFAFSSVESDIIEKVDKLLRENYKMCLCERGGCDYAIRYIENPKHNGSRGDKGQHPIVRNFDPMTTLKGQLDSYGLLCKSVDKHIPVEYLLNDRNTRIRLLQGLYDTDGCTGSDGATAFSTSSKRLSDDFAFLVRSLGIRDTVSVKRGKYRKDGELVEVCDTYSHYLHMPDDFPYHTSEKHRMRRTNRQHGVIRNIISIDYVGDEECQCIMVDNLDHTYISDDFIPTHNTTCGRIFAREINKGKGGLVELDAASHNSVDDVRQLTQQAKTQSLDSEYRIFLVDECQSITASGWQAFLKVLEEPPKKSVFIFATTDPQKIPKTILSRVQRYDFKRLSQKAVVSRLEYVLSEEVKAGNLADTDKHDLDALKYLAKLSEGGMRDALTLLDKCLSFSSDVTVENVVKALGTVNYELMFKLTDAVNEARGADIISTIETIHSDGKDLKQFIKSYMGFLLDVVKFDITKSFDFLSMPNIYEEALQHKNQEWFRCGQKLLDTVVRLNSAIKWDTQPKTTIEATLLGVIL